MSLLGAMIKTYKADGLPREKLRALQQRRLKELVSFARVNSPYYDELFAGVGDDPRLEDLPSTTKPEMMANFDRIVTDRNVTMDRIDQYTEDPENIGRMMDGKYLVFKTSGSTGNPAVVLYDKTCVDIASAIAAFRTFARKEDFRSFVKHGKKTAGVFADHGFYLACGMSRYLQLSMPKKQTKITVDVNSPEEQIVSELNAFGPSMLSGYPSNLALLADCRDLDIHPDVVITGGELLTDQVREKLHKKFGCYVQTHYSCTEGGEVACECSEGHLHINEDWVIVEPVDGDYNHVGYGKLSDKVLITNLANRIQPFIRYELTDRIIVHDEPCPCGKKSMWLEIEGRTDDILEFERGVKIAPMSLYRILEEIKPVRRFQLIQRSPRSIELRLVCDDKETTFREAERELKAFFAEKELPEMEIYLSGSDPKPDPVSGKFKHIYKGY